MSSQPCRRCSQCGTDWPNVTPTYSTCPVCEVTTAYFSNGRPLHEKDATRQINYLRFDAHYEETRGVDSTDDSGTVAEPQGEVEGEYHPQHQEGFICWHCDTVPRRLGDGELTIDEDCVLRLDGAVVGRWAA